MFSNIPIQRIPRRMHFRGFGDATFAPGTLLAQMAASPPGTMFPMPSGPTESAPPVPLSQITLPSGVQPPPQLLAVTPPEPIPIPTSVSPVPTSLPKPELKPAVPVTAQPGTKAAPLLIGGALLGLLLL